MSAQVEATTAPAEMTPPVAPAASSKPATNTRQVVIRTVLLVGAVAALTFAVQHWMFSRTHVSTDNAEIEGSVVPAVARVSGFVDGVHVQDNQSVKAGELLVQLDDREQRAKLAQAEADYAAAQAAAGANGHVGQTGAQIETARAQVEQAAAVAKRAHDDVERYRPLAERAIVSRQQLDAAVATDQSAAAALDAARKQVLAAQAGWQSADAKLQAAKAARDQAALTLSYTRITAPIDGIVSRKNVEPGQLLQSGQTILAVVPTNDLYVTANLKETQIEHVRPGNTVKIDVDAYPGHPVAGTVESFSPATGARFSLLPPDNATGNYTHVVQHIPVRIRVTDFGAPERPLRPGMSVQVTIDTGKH
jgi:membrane fusion protein (multidrug efflux system)